MVSSTVVWQLYLVTHTGTLTGCWPADWRWKKQGLLLAHMLALLLEFGGQKLGKLGTCGPAASVCCSQQVLIGR